MDENFSCPVKRTSNQSAEDDLAVGGALLGVEALLLDVDGAALQVGALEVAGLVEVGVKVVDHGFHIRVQ